jgi:hypothetical protein
MYVCVYVLRRKWLFHDARFKGQGARDGNAFNKSKQTAGY